MKTNVMAGDFLEPVHEGDLMMIVDAVAGDGILLRHLLHGGYAYHSYALFSDIASGKVALRIMDGREVRVFDECKSE